MKTPKRIEPLVQDGIVRVVTIACGVGFKGVKIAGILDDVDAQLDRVDLELIRRKVG